NKKSKIELLFANDETDENDENDVPLTVVQRAMKNVAEAESKNTASELLEPYNVARGKMVKDEEEEGIIRFHVVGNLLTKPLDSGSIGIMLALQSLFGKQLPKIPAEYISRLVFDEQHKCLALIKQYRTIGGICFRPFRTQGFAEIVFCAVSLADQLKGYGSQMMNQLKDFVLSQQIQHLITFADCNAIGYFSKQGFSKRIRLERSVYEGYIKEYDNATLMHCELHPDIVNTQFLSVVRQQGAVLREIIEQKQQSVQRVRPGLKCFKEGVTSIPIQDIPGIDEFNWRPSIKTNSGKAAKCALDADPAKLKSAFASVLRSVRRHNDAWCFQEPVKVSQVPDYYDIIKYPMNLSKMEQRLTAGYYCTRHLFNADMTRIFTNCRLYNAAGTDFYRCATTLERYYQQLMRQMGLWLK
ncbi:hypothetical protein KR044_006088, partial [Drosophila immigrans]